MSNSSCAFYFLLSGIALSYGRSPITIVELSRRLHQIIVKYWQMICIKKKEEKESKRCMKAKLEINKLNEFKIIHSTMSIGMDREIERKKEQKEDKHNNTFCIFWTLKLYMCEGTTRSLSFSYACVCIFLLLTLYEYNNFDLLLYIFICVWVPGSALVGQ